MIKPLAFLAVAVISTHVFAAPAGILDNTHASVRAVAALQGELTPDLMKLPNVLGTAVGVTDNGDVSLVIYVEEGGQFTGNLVSGIPRTLRGHAVNIEITDRFRTFAPGGNGGGKPGGGGGTTVSHTAKQTPPISLGTSGGWQFDLANGYCCGGTLGSLVQAGGRKFILSNYHVLEADINPGGNNDVATLGDPIIQPALIDINCNANNSQAIATLVPLSSLPLNSNVDAAIAEIAPGMVKETGDILQIGTISSQIVNAFINQPVKKAGRTTALTKSKITGLNATVSVSYENECAGQTVFTKTFTGQIIIANRRSAFLKGGDSGSLMVEDVAANPRAVGLLFAGSNTSAVANPIGEVLAYISAALSTPEAPVTATMVGN